MADVKFSQFAAAIGFTTGDEVVGLRSGVNTIFSDISSFFLQAGNNLSDLTNVTTAVANLSLTPGTNTQPYSAVLTALAALSGTGILVQTGATSFTEVSITGTINSITVTNGSGVSGNPTLAISGTYPGQTSITTLGTITTGTWSATPVALASGGTGANLTASNGGIFYSNATTGAILAGVATANLPLLSGLSSAPSWGAYPISLGGALITGGAVTFSGAYGVTFTFTNTTNVTFPTSGTLATVDGSLTSITTDSGTATVSAGSVTISGGTTGLTTTGSGSTVDLTGILKLANGGSNANLTASAGGIVWSNSTQMQILAGTTTAKQLLLSGNAATPSWSTSTYPSTNAINTLLYASAANTMSALSTGNNGVLITSATGVPSWLAAGTTGQVLTATTGSPPTWAAASGSGTVVTGTINDLAYYASSGTAVSPLATVASAVLTTVSSVPTWAAELSLALGGTNAALTASNGGIFYSTASAGAILAGTSTAKQMLQSGATAAPAWSTSTWPSTTTINQLLYSNAANTVTGLATVTTAVLTTAAGVPTWATELSLALGGTNAALTANNGGIFYSTASAGAILSGTATAGLALLSGASGAPTWSTLPPITKINRQIFTSSGTYTASSGLQYAYVQEVGSGGGSGGAASTTAQCAASGGGQSGGYNAAWISGATIGASQTITIGAAGTAGTSSSAGGAGGNVSFGTLLTAVGGAGSANAASTTAGASAGGTSGGGTGGSAGNQFAIAGQTGGQGFAIVSSSSIYMPGGGGSNPLGQGGLSNFDGANATLNGTVGSGYGAGASGAGCGGTSGTAAGAAGTKGIIIIDEYISI